MAKKLVIRINNLQGVESNGSYEKYEETVIRWGRVAAVAVLVLSLAFAVIWGIFNQYGNEQPGEPGAPLEVAPLALAPTAPVKADAVEITLVKPVVDHPKPDVDPAVKPVVETVVALEHEAVEPLQNIVASVISQNGAGTKPVNIAFADPVTILSSNILRAQLTHTLKKGEPGETLDDQISMNGEGLIKVYLFTEMTGLKGETLYHDWYLDGKRMARVRIYVKQNSLKASSSKYIDKYMMGGWSVKVANSQGQPMIAAQFRVTP